jgi:hypothetical protein
MNSQARWLVHWGRRRAFAIVALALVCVTAGVAYALTRSNSSSSSSTIAPTSTGGVVNVSQAVVGKVRPQFLGLSLEIRGIESYTGTDAKAINPVFVQLIKNLNPGQSPLLRIGGDSTDWTWFPYRKGPHPLGVRYTLTPTWFKVIRALAQDLNARLILGVNLEQDSAAVSRAEADAFVSRIGEPYVEALALGNEPELYHGLVWFSLDGHRYYGRPASWDFGEYQSNYAQMLRALPDYELAGPDVGGPAWEPDLGQFLSSEPRVKIATIHRYPLKDCTPSQHATIAELLSDGSTRQFMNGLSSEIHAAHAHGASFRIDETNSVSCGGAVGVSNTFASGLWALDAMFEMARAGVDGVNVHTRQVPNQLFTFAQSGGRWKSTVEPDYYGLLAFAQAAPANSQLLGVSGFSSGPVHVWATRAPDGIERVVLINMASSGSVNVDVRIGSGTSSGTVERLLAPNLAATGHVSLGGQSFSTGTSTGLLTGAPQTSTVIPSSRGYPVKLPAASAAILTLPPS